MWVITRSHTWRSGDAYYRQFESVELKAEFDRLSAGNRFSTCIDFGKTYAEHQVLCDEWEVPAGWTSGQPLIHVSQKLRQTHFHELASSVTAWTWVSSKEKPPVSAESLKTTAEPINDNGISGALLAAMFDAWTPRATGMKALPGFASATKGALDLSAGRHKPERVSVYHESRANTYADGGTDTGTYSPATGSYLYAFRSGTWKSETEGRSTSEEFRQSTMAMHLNHDPAKGLTLPRWAGLHELGLKYGSGEQIWLYQGEQVSRDDGGKLIAPNDLLLFGSTVQYWRDPGQYSDSKKLAIVRLTIEKSNTDARSVDLCWTTATGTGTAASKNCTTWVVPQGWAPGQELKPQSYYAAAIWAGLPVHWSSRAAR